MKRKMSLFLSVLGVLFLAAGMMTNRALAATPDCFSDVTTHWAEDFICWMKDNGLSSGYPDGTFRPDNPITRAEVAVLLRQMRSTGVVQINVGPTGFQPATGSDGTIQYFAGTSRLKSTLGNFNNAFISSVAIPSSLYNSRMFLNAVKICYTLQGGGFISNVNFSLYSSSGSVVDGVSSADDLTTNGCTTYNFAAPIGVDGGEYLQATINSAGVSSITDWVNMNSVTVYMTPSAEAAVAKEAE